MSNVLISLLIGFAAAIVDIIPMIVRKVNTHFTISAFLFWIVAGVVIPGISITSIGWMNGAISAVILFLPISILIWKLDREALPMIIVTTIILGGSVGFLSSRFIS